MQFTREWTCISSIPLSHRNIGANAVRYRKHSESIDGNIQHQ